MTDLTIIVIATLLATLMFFIARNDLHKTNMGLWNRIFYNLMATVGVWLSVYGFLNMF